MKYSRVWRAASYMLDNSRQPSPTADDSRATNDTETDVAAWLERFSLDCTALSKKVYANVFEAGFRGTEGFYARQLGVLRWPAQYVNNGWNRQATRVYFLFRLPLHFSCIAEHRKTMFLSILDCNGTNPQRSKGFHFNKKGWKTRVYTDFGGLLCQNARDPVEYGESENVHRNTAHHNFERRALLHDWSLQCGLSYWSFSS